MSLAGHSVQECGGYPWLHLEPTLPKRGIEEGLWSMRAPLLKEMWGSDAGVLVPWVWQSSSLCDM